MAEEMAEVASFDNMQSIDHAENMEDVEAGGTGHTTDDDETFDDAMEDQQAENSEADIYPTDDNFLDESDCSTSGGYDSGEEETKDYQLPLREHVDRIIYQVIDAVKNDQDTIDELNNLPDARMDVDLPAIAPSTLPPQNQSVPNAVSVKLSMAESYRVQMLTHGKVSTYKEILNELKISEEELAECLKRLALARIKMKKIEKKDSEAEEKVTAAFKDIGISPELYAAYEAFCESLNPQRGLHDGFEIETFGEHDGNYIQYDPTFAIFKECVKDEMAYNDRNFRVEAPDKSLRPLFGDKKIPLDIVFWPLKCLEPLTEDVRTWEDQYPELYRLAINAVRRGSEGAMEMLVRLPDMDAELGGGWLFDYQQEPALLDHPIKSKQWRFRSAHKIDSPVSVEEKRSRLRSMLWPESI